MFQELHYMYMYSQKLTLHSFQFDEKIKGIREILQEHGMQALKCKR